MKLVDKTTLVAEIERIKKEECPIDTYEGRIKLFYFERFLSFIDTLEVKEVDLEQEFDKCCENYIFNDLYALYTARRFFKLGFKARKEE